MGPMRKTGFRGQFLRLTFLKQYSRGSLQPLPLILKARCRYKYAAAEETQVKV